MSTVNSEYWGSGPPEEEWRWWTDHLWAQVRGTVSGTVDGPLREDVDGYFYTARVPYKIIVVGPLIGVQWDADKGKILAQVGGYDGVLIPVGSVELLDGMP